MITKKVFDNGSYEVTFKDVKDSSGNTKPVLFYADRYQSTRQDCWWFLYWLYLVFLTVSGGISGFLSLIMLAISLASFWLTFQSRLHGALQSRDNKLQFLLSFVTLAVSDKILVKIRSSNQEESDEALEFLKNDADYNKLAEGEKINSMLQGIFSNKYKNLFSFAALFVNGIGLAIPFLDIFGSNYSTTSKLLVVVPFAILAFSYTPFLKSSEIVDFADAINDSSISPTTKDVVNIDNMVLEFRKKNFLSREHFESIDKLIKDLL